jgi:BRCA1-associated protein
MRSYFFHLVFELYSPESLNQADQSTSVFLPQPNTDIFESDLPEHSTVPWTHSLDQTFQRPSHKRRNSDPLSSHRKAIFHESHAQKSNHSSQSKQQAISSNKQSHLAVAKKDYRFSGVSIVSVDMEESSSGKQTRLVRGKSFGNENRASALLGGITTKGVFIPSDPKNTDIGYGIVHLYRNVKETSGLYEDGIANSKAGASSASSASIGKFDAENCTTLCILAVPSYMTPSDLLGYVGEKTREEVSHFRLIRTGRTNKYMVLMKFREANSAKEWQKEWNGKPFNSMEVSQDIVFKML